MQKAIHHLSIATAVYVLTFLTNMPDFDLWARLAVGSAFFQTGHVLRHDIFSYLPTKDLWIDHEWGSGVVFYGFARYLGEHGIFLLKALLICSIFVMVRKTISRAKASRPRAPCSTRSWAMRSSLGSRAWSAARCSPTCSSAVWIYGLERVRRKERKILWVFPCTMLFWVNLHGGFVAGVGLVLLYAVGELLNRKSPLPYLWIVLSILPVTLINPYGFALWRNVVEASLHAQAVHTRMATDKSERPDAGHWRMAGPLPDRLHAARRHDAGRGFLVVRAQ